MGRLDFQNLNVCFYGTGNESLTFLCEFCSPRSNRAFNPRTQFRATSSSVLMTKVPTAMPHAVEHQVVWAAALLSELIAWPAVTQWNGIQKKSASSISGIPEASQQQRNVIVLAQIRDKELNHNFGKEQRMC